MKIVAFTDIHSSITVLKKLKALMKKEKPDLVICCGDFTVFEQNIEHVIEKIAELHDNILLTHGNHESGNIVKKLCSKYKNITYMHKQSKKIGDATFVVYGGLGFSHEDKPFERFAKGLKLSKEKKVVLVTHQPPFGTKLDVVWDDHHVGNQSFTKFISDHDNCVLALSGHIHETFKKKQKLNNAKLVNPGPEGMVLKL